MSPVGTIEMLSVVPMGLAVALFVSFPALRAGLLSRRPARDARHGFGQVPSLLGAPEVRFML